MTGSNASKFPEGSPVNSSLPAVLKMPGNALPKPPLGYLCFHATLPVL